MSHHEVYVRIMPPTMVHVQQICKLLVSNKQMSLYAVNNRDIFIVENFNILLKKSDQSPLGSTLNFICLNNPSKYASVVKIQL